MTEEEAKTKWCPFVRASFADTTSDKMIVVGNRLLTDDAAAIQGSFCIASACMAWRGHTTEVRIPGEGAYLQGKPAEGWTLHNGTLRDTHNGHCGLASKV